MSGEEIPDASGYFLYTVSHTTRPETVEILARVQSDEAAWRLRNMFGLT
jgi:hypothetical protein